MKHSTTERCDPSFVITSWLLVPTNIIKSSFINTIYFIPLYLLSFVRFSHIQVVNHCSKLVQVILHCINWLHPRHEELLSQKYFVDKSFVNMPLLKSFPNPLGYYLLSDVHELIVRKTLNEKIQSSSILPFINQKSKSIWWI